MAKLQNVLTALFVMGPAESWVTIPLFVLYLGPEVESMVSFSKRMMVLGILSGPSFLQEEKRKIPYFPRSCPPHHESKSLKLLRLCQNP